MTTFAKILLGLIIVTGAVLLVKGPSDKKMADNDESMEEITEESSDTETVVEDDKQMEEGSFSGSMKDLMSRGGEYKCTFASNTEVGTSTGTVYISGDKIRGDFESSVEVVSQTFKSSMINDGEFSYVWSSSMPGGFKTKNVEGDISGEESVDTGFDYNEQLDYKCVPWSVDNSVFALPDIEFTELNTEA